MPRADRLPFKYRSRLLGSPPVSARHVEWSAIASTDDEPAQPTDQLLGLALAAAERARHLRLDEIGQRCGTRLEGSWVNHWPGEHYRLLASLVEVAGVRRAVEVGTYTGMGALALAGPGVVVQTYDLVPWDQVPNTLLRREDFYGRISQRIGDLAGANYFDSQLDDLRAADLILVDGPKDGVFEPAFLARLLPVLRAGQVLVLDDIRKLQMLQTWRDLPLPKLDVTSLGHWSGTGLATVPPK
jgi:predicted O-methyltransferase YrrM